MSTLRTLTRLATRTAGPLVSLAFPPACWADDRPLPESDLNLSTPTREQIARALLDPYCHRCGSTISPHAARAKNQDCPRCPQRQMGLASIARVGIYEPPLAPLITTLKFSRHWELASTLAPFLLQAIQLHLAASPALQLDTLIPIPLHWRRRLSRGFNQSEELATHLSRLAHWPIASALRRTRATQQQSLLQSAHQRMENLRGAFRAIPTPKIAGKHVWLIDDVCTTGATLKAATRAFMELPKLHRPATIHAAVIAIPDKMSLAHFSE